jgi:hypothetical protein
VSSPVVLQSTLRFASRLSPGRSGSVSVCGLSPELVISLAGCEHFGGPLKSVFRVRVAALTSEEDDCLPDVSGRFCLHDDEVEFIPTFPFESDVKYHVTFDPAGLGFPVKEGALTLEFSVPSHRAELALTEVSHVYPSSDCLPENLLRFYVCFSNSMQRGRALAEISLLDSVGHPVADALYRPPIELWDKSMRHLTVLLDPGRLKRWVGPNMELGPPLAIGKTYTLEIGSGMTDLHGRPLREPFRKHFLVGDPIREPVAAASWKLLPPPTGSREALALIFPQPLDRAMLSQMITVVSEDLFRVPGEVVIDQAESRWRFTPTSCWSAGVYHVRVRSDLEDVCGNSLTGAFDRPVRRDPGPVTQNGSSTLTFNLA